MAVLTYSRGSAFFAGGVRDASGIIRSGVTGSEVSETVAVAVGKAPLPRPTGLSTQSEFSTVALPNGMYYACVVAVDDAGGMTLPSDEVSFEITSGGNEGGEGGYGLAWDVYPGVAAYRVYVGTTPGGQDRFYLSPSGEDAFVQIRGNYSLNSETGPWAGTPPTESTAVILGMNGTVAVGDTLLVRNGLIVGTVPGGSLLIGPSSWPTYLEGKNQYAAVFDPDLTHLAAAPLGPNWQADDWTKGDGFQQLGVVRLTYDVSTHGGAIGAHSFAAPGMTQYPRLNDDMIVVGGLVAIPHQWAFGSATGAATLRLTMGDHNLVTAARVDGSPWSTEGIKPLVPLFSDPSTWFRADSSYIQAVVAVEAVTSGRLRLDVFFVRG